MQLQLSILVEMQIVANDEMTSLSGWNGCKLEAVAELSLHLQMLSYYSAPSLVMRMVMMMVMVFVMVITMMTMLMIVVMIG